MHVNRYLSGVLLVLAAAVFLTSCRVQPAGEGRPANVDPSRGGANVAPAEAPARRPASPAASHPAQVGTASYYGHWHHGRLTANGERFDATALTAAHRTLPFGTLARVTDVSSGRQVTVRITDRGPFIRGRVIDLSYGAAKQLEMIEAGLAQVRIDVLDAGAPDFAVAVVN